MKICKYSILAAIVMVLNISLISAQSVTPAMMQQAAAMGYSEADVLKAAQQSGGSSSSSTSSTPKRSTSTNKSGQTQRSSGRIDTDTPSHGGENGGGTFGQGLFRNDDVSFEPNINIPTPKDYLLTPGDQIIITIWGDSELLYKENISPDGVINVPNYGPINISGMRVDEAQKHLEQRLSKSYESLGSTSQLMLSVGQIGTIRVNVSGEVANPGTYTLPAIANMFHLLHLCGGTTNLGNMRKIELYRNSKLVTTLDLYDYILRGDASGNTLLKDGDILVVNTYNVRVSISGHVKRPMRYQMSDGDKLSNLIEYAGGFSEGAYNQEVKIYRNNGIDREVIMVNSEDFASVELIDGDDISVAEANNEYKNIISISGAVWRGGNFQFDEQVNNLSALIEKAGGLMGDAFANRGVITRRNPDYTTTLISFVTADVAAGISNVDLQNYDKVYIPTIESLREDYTITITGEVNSPKTIGFHDDMRIEDVIVKAGGLRRSASLATLDVTRRINNSNSLDYSDQIAETYNFQINEDLTLNESTKNFVLEPFDVIVVRRSPQFAEQKKIYIMGEVILPGTYSLTKENTYLSDVINMAKGTTPNAYIEGVSLTRVSNTSRRGGGGVNNEDFFTEDNISNLALNNLRGSMSRRDTLEVTTSDLRTYSVGVDMNMALKDPHGPDDVLLQANDIVLIPKLNNIVNVVGSVYYPNATTHSTNRLKYYVNASGGYNKSAVKKPFVIHPNGKIYTTKNYVLFKIRPKVLPGCLVVVPAKSERERASAAEVISAISGVSSLATSISTLGVAIGK